MDSLSRRSFLKQLTVVGGALLLANTVSAAYADDTSAAVPTTWVPLGPVSSFPKGSVTPATLPDKYNDLPVMVSTDATGAYKVLSAKCTHRGCIVAYTPSVNEYICPCHGGTFDATGAVVSGPPKRPLPSFATKIDTGTLYIAVPTPTAPTM